MLFGTVQSVPELASMKALSEENALPRTNMPVTATPTRAAEFRETLAQRVWVADGAMGTMLYSKGAFINRCYDELNLSLPALVRDVHQEYVRAGAEIIETNTFGANRKRLASFGFADKVRLINRAGVRIAREAARPTRPLSQPPSDRWGFAWNRSVPPPSTKPVPSSASRSKPWSKPASTA